MAGLYHGRDTPWRVPTYKSECYRRVMPWHDPTLREIYAIKFFGGIHLFRFEYRRVAKIFLIFVLILEIYTWILQLLFGNYYLATIV